MAPRISKLTTYEETHSIDSKPLDFWLPIFLVIYLLVVGIGATVIVILTSPKPRLVM